MDPGRVEYTAIFGSFGLTLSEETAILNLSEMKMGDEYVNKRPFWKRVNRGAVLSLALAGAALLYVLTTQLLLLPDKRELRELAESVHTLAAPYLAPSDSELLRLTQPEEQKREIRALETAMQPLFVEEAQYIGQSAEDVLAMATGQQELGMRLRTLRLEELSTGNCTISEDTGYIQLVGRYAVSGQFYDYHTNQLTDEHEEEMTLYLTLACKETDNGWRIHRVTHFAWDDNGESFGLI